MNLWSAAVFLVGTTMRNWGRGQLQRLRRPRYALGLVVVLLYVWSVGIRTWLQETPMASPGALDTVSLMLVCIATLGISAAWVLGGDDAVLRFTQAEVQFLFPAPTTRRQLVIYKMGRMLIGTVFSTIFATLIFAPRITAHRGWFAIGTFLALSTLNFHLSAASQTRAMLVDLGLAGIRRRLVTLGVVVSVLGAIGWAAVTTAPPPELHEGTEAMLLWATTASRTPPLGWVLLPVRAPIEVALAQELQTFLVGLPVAVGGLLAHAAWVLWTATAFEDASVAAAETRAQQVQVRRRGWSPLGRLRVPIPLAGTGRPEVALAWKSVIAAIRLASLRLVLALALMGFTIALLAASLMEGESTGLVIAAVVAASTAGYLALMGAQLLRVDLRLDLPQMDLLRSWPLTGRAVVMGQIAGPALILAVMEWICLLAALILGTGWPGPPDTAGRLALVAALGIALPILSLCGLVVQNGAVLVFPEWAVLDAQVGPEVLGRRLILLVLNLGLMVFGTLPATVVGAGVLVVGLPLIGEAALPLAALAGAAVVLVELWLVVGMLGRWFEQFDVSDLGGLSDS